jgi:hypothetical protein
MPDQGRPGQINLRPDAEIGEVVHEVTHWEQDRDRHYLDQPAIGSDQWRQDEADARRAELDQVGDRYPDIERDRIGAEIQQLERGLRGAHGEGDGDVTLDTLDE